MKSSQAHRTVSTAVPFHISGCQKDDTHGKIFFYAQIGMFKQVSSYNCMKIMTQSKHENGCKQTLSVN